METSNEIGEIAAALSKAQGEVENAAKSSTNPHFKSRYADLAEVINAIREPMAKNGLSVIQAPSFDGELVTVTTHLSHTSGQWMRSTLSIPIGRKDAQSIGSAITYGRRYSLAPLFLVSQEDDDGNAATQGAEQKRNGTAKPVQQQTQRIDLDRSVSQEQPPEPVEFPSEWVIEGKVKSKGKALSQLEVSALEAAINNPQVNKMLTPADKVNIAAYLASENGKLEAIRKAAAEQGSSLEEDEIPAAYN